MRSFDRGSPGGRKGHHHGEKDPGGKGESRRGVPRGEWGSGAKGRRHPSQRSGGRAAASSVSWGDPLLRFIKLDGFPSFWKAQDFAALANFYKPQLTASVADLYFKYDDQVNDVLALYQKADQGPLGRHPDRARAVLEARRNIKPLLDTLKEPGAMDAYIKFNDFYKAMGQVSPEGGGALEFFQKATGILGVPAPNSD